MLTALAPNRIRAMNHHTAPTAELLALEQALWHADTRYDPAFQQRHFAADFFEFGRSGNIYPRADCIMQSGPPIQANLLNMQLRELAEGLIQLVYDSVVTGTDGRLQYAHRSSLWSRQDDVWVLRFHQGTPYQP